MRKIIIFLFLASIFSIPVRALDLSAPTVPKYAESMFPEDPQNLREGVRKVLRNALALLRPDLAEAGGICAGITAAVVAVSILQTFPGSTEQTINLVGTIGISAFMVSSAGAMINLAVDTIGQISEYGKLFLPVMAAALAAQGGITTSSGLFAGTALFDAILSRLISRVLTPMIYCYLALGISSAALGEEMLKKLRDLLKSFMTWSLKTVLYVFTGFLSVTGVISGPTDASVLKVTRLTISGMVPVVGGILSDASEAVLVSAGTVKNAIGLYGMFAVAAIFLEPFVMIGCHYLMLRITCGICCIFGSKRLTDLIQDFATAMGMLVGMTGAVGLMQLISTVCFMRGMG